MGPLISGSRKCGYTRSRINTHVGKTSRSALMALVLKRRSTSIYRVNIREKSLTDVSGYKQSAGARTSVRPQAAQVELHLASRFEPGDSSLTVDYDVSNRFTGRVHSAAGHIIISLWSKENLNCPNLELFRLWFIDLGKFKDRSNA